MVKIVQRVQDCHLCVFRDFSLSLLSQGKIFFQSFEVLCDLAMM